MRVFRRAIPFALALVTLLSAGATAQGQKIGYIRSSAILDQAPGRAEAEAQFDKETSGYRDQIKRMSDSLNAMVAADCVLVPLQCEFYALEGLSQLIKTIERVKHKLNPVLEVQGVVLTMFDKRSSLNEQVAADVRQHFGDKVYDTAIPRNVRIAEAPSYGMPALLYDIRCAGSQAYILLASEVLKREQGRIGRSLLNAA